MQISTRGRYAVMAMVDLASRGASAGCQGACEAPVCLAEIAARQRLSQAYLEQLFGKLRRAELVWSSRGPGGGYRLARPSDSIAIADIVRAVDEPLRTTRCDAGGGCPAAANAGTAETQCQTHDLWLELGRQIGFFLSGITLADVVLGQVAGRAAPVPAMPDGGGVG